MLYFFNSPPGGAEDSNHTNMLKPCSKTHVQAQTSSLMHIFLNKRFYRTVHWQRLKPVTQTFHYSLCLHCVYCAAHWGAFTCFFLWGYQRGFRYRPEGSRRGLEIEEKSSNICSHQACTASINSHFNSPCQTIYFYILVWLWQTLHMWSNRCF